MSQIPSLTNKLALQIESVIAPEINGSKETQDPTEPIIKRFGRTVASKAISGRPVNTVYCFGQDDLKSLEDILAFYAVDNLNPYFCLAPMGFTNRVAVALRDLGFFQRDFGQAILYGAPRVTPPQLSPDVMIERVTMANLDEFAHTTAMGFEWPHQWRNEAIADIQGKFKPEKYHFLARFQGAPAGVGSLDVRDKVASLIDGAVIPRFRKKGIHSDLIQHRLYVAHTLDCSIVVGGTAFGSTSFRNQQRAGLQIAYIESGWSKQSVKQSH